MAALEKGPISATPVIVAVAKPRNLDDVDLSCGMSERPISELTDMSYTLQRILAGGSIAGRSRIGIRSRSPKRTRRATSVLTLDAELSSFMDEMPSFYLMSEETLPASAQPPHIVAQAYMLHALANTQRCRLHLPYLTRARADATYLYSRRVCLQTAQRIIKIDKHFEASGTPSPQLGSSRRPFCMRCFVATIVLLTDLCMNKYTSEKEHRQTELVGAFARSRAHAATPSLRITSPDRWLNFFESTK